MENYTLFVAIISAVAIAIALIRYFRASDNAEKLKKDLQDAIRKNDELLKRNNALVNNINTAKSKINKLQESIDKINEEYHTALNSLLTEERIRNANLEKARTEYRKLNQKKREFEDLSNEQASSLKRQASVSARLWEDREILKRSIEIFFQKFENGDELKAFFMNIKKGITPKVRAENKAFAESAPEREEQKRIDTQLHLAEVQEKAIARQRAAAEAEAANAELRSLKKERAAQKRAERSRKRREQSAASRRNAQLKKQR